MDVSIMDVDMWPVKTTAPLFPSYVTLVPSHCLLPPTLKSLDKRKENSESNAISFLLLQGMEIFIRN